MSAKRESGNNGNGPTKRSKKNNSDFKKEVGNESNQIDPPSKLPDDLLATLEKTPGKMLIAGMVTWDLTGKRDRKNVMKVRPNLYNFHRFTDEKVSSEFDSLNPYINGLFEWP